MKKLVGSIAVAICLVFGFSSPAAARLVGEVDLSAQTMTVTKNGRVLYRWPVSTGRSGYRTPTGTWSPTRTHKMWRSRKYDGSPMPHSVFYYGGYAIHGTYSTRQLGRPASHGCVRLHPSNAQAFYQLVQQSGIHDTRIVVKR